MDNRQGGGSMDAAGQDAWGWVVLPDQLMTSSMESAAADLAVDQETSKEETGVVTASSDAADVHDDDEPVEECKDIGVVLDETASNKEEDEAMTEVTDPSPASEAEVEDDIKTFQISIDGEKKADDDEEAASQGEEVEEKKAFQSPDHAEKSSHDEKFDEEEEEEAAAVKKEQDGGARPDDCVVFSVGKLKVNGIGALCSFGIVAATVCIFLIGGGKMQQHHRQQQQKIQLQFYGDDKRIQQVVQQTSRLNQAMSSVMGAGGTSTRANITFGGFYDGF